MSRYNNLTWESIDWRLVTNRVLRIQRRIYKAQTSKTKSRVHWLQKHLINSLDAKLLAVRTVTTLNKGRKTPGVDKQVIIKPSDKMTMAKKLTLNGKASLIKRGWIAKPGKAEKRLLGIPTIQDRAKQALAKLALEPEWEAKFEPNSYGFRPGRSAHDAIEAIFLALCHNKPKWVFDADIKKCFNRIDHTYLLSKLQTFPQMESQVHSWLKAGIIEEYSKFPKIEPSSTPFRCSGTPQGGIISPLLSNIALHGLEEHLKKYVGDLSFKPSPTAHRGKEARMKSLTFVRYADDFVVIHPLREILDLCVDETRKWLSKVGLEISEEKSSVKDCRESFLFLGFQIILIWKNKQYRVKIVPSKNSRKRFLDNVNDIIKSNRSVSTYELISKLRPVVIGWGNYFRFCECSDTYKTQTHLLFQMLRHWVFRRHPNSARSVVKEKYWPSERTYYYDETKHQDNWVLCGKDLKKGVLVENHLPQMHWIHSRKFVKIQPIKSPFDSDHAYWALRNSKYSAFPLRVSKLYKEQNGICNYCKKHFDTFSKVEVDHTIPRALGGKDVYSNLQLLHQDCHLNKTNADMVSIAEKRR